MKVVIVDDRPFLMWETIGQLRDMGVDEIDMLYFQGDLTHRPERDDEIEQKCRELNVPLIQTKRNIEFRKAMDKYWEEENTIIFVDYNLGDTEIFEKKIDITYAKEKRHRENFCIWFYTTLGEEIVGRLNEVFNNHTIPIVEYIPQEEKLEMDYEYIQDEILNGNV